jgi:hypothetical protein
MGLSWAQSTKELYGAGLLLFHVFCDLKNVSKEDQCPINQTLLLEFISSCAGSYSGSSLANYTAGLKAWHLLHGRTWPLAPLELKAVIDGANTLALQSSKQLKRRPFTPNFIEKIQDQLDLNSPWDTAVFMCLTTTFYSVARLGEFTVKAISDFNPRKHITKAGVSESEDCNGLPVTKFH